MNEATAGILFDYDRYKKLIAHANPIKVFGKVSQVIGLVVEGRGPCTSIGEMCEIFADGNGEPLSAEVVGFKTGKVLMMPLEGNRGVGPGCKIVSLGKEGRCQSG